jgi:hypothetical protein
VIAEQQQAAFIKTMATKYFACDPTVVGVQLFLLVDEKYRNGRDEAGSYIGGGWQSGLVTAGGQQKLAYSASAPIFQAGRNACAGQMISWSPVKAASVNGGKSGKQTGSNSKPVKAKKLPKCKKGRHSTKRQPCRR